MTIFYSLYIMLLALNPQRLDINMSEISKVPVAIKYQIWAYPSGLFKIVDYGSIYMDICSYSSGDINNILNDIDCNINMQLAYTYVYFQTHPMAEDELVTFLLNQRQAIMKAAALLGYAQDRSSLRKEILESRNRNMGSVIYKEVDVADVRYLESKELLDNLIEIYRNERDLMLEQLYKETTYILVGNSVKNKR